MATTLLRYHALWWAYLSQYIKAHMEYRANFFVECLSYLLWIGTDVALLYFVLLPVQALNGWTFPQVVLMYAISMTGLGMFMFLGINLFYLPQRYILEGQLDQLLIRPVNPYFQLLMEKVSPEDWSTMVIGLGLAGWAMMELGIGITPLQIGKLLLAVCGSALIYGGFQTASGALSFFLKDRSGTVHFTLEAAYMTSSYPLSIFPRLARLILTLLIPVGFMSFYPAHLFFGETTGMLSMAAWATPIVGLITFLVGYLAWLRGLKAYESAGS